MSLRPDGQSWVIREQIVEDPVSGLTFQFEVRPDGEMALLIFGDKLEYGNREIFFDRDGAQTAAGTHTSGHCRPAWMTELGEAKDKKP